MRYAKRPTDVYQTPLTVFAEIDSRTVAMRVGTRSGVCNNSPAESASSEHVKCLKNECGEKKEGPRRKFGNLVHDQG